MPRARSPLAAVPVTCVAVALAAILVLTLRPSGPAPTVLRLCIGCGTNAGADLLRNVLLFVPFGAALAWAGVGVRRAVLAGFLLSLSVEVLQLGVVTGRYASLGDLLTNTIGAALGALLARHRLLLWRPAGAQRRRLATWYSIGAGALAIASWWSTAPVSATPPHFIQRVPVRPWTTPLRARLLAGGLDGRDLWSGPVEDPSLGRAIVAGRFVLTATILPNGEEPGFAFAVRLVGGTPVEEIASIGVRGRRVAVRTMTRADALGLTVPVVVTAAALPPDVATPIAWNPRRSLLLVGRDTVATVQRSAVRAWAWALPHPLALDIGVVRLADALFGVLLVAPLAWWYRPGTGRSRAA